MYTTCYEVRDLAKFAAFTFVQSQGLGDIKNNISYDTMYIYSSNHNKQPKVEIVTKVRLHFWSSKIRPV